MAAPIAFDIAFPTQYELIELDRIDRSGGKRAYSYPGARPVDRQQELAAAPILEVKPAAGDPWIALFCGVEGFAVPPALRQAVIALPDGRTFCMIKEGSGVCVRADEPASTDEIESFPITHYLVNREVELVVFADFTNLVAYGSDGVAWRSRRLALDDLKIVGGEGETLHVTGFLGDEEGVPFTVNLLTGVADGQPWQPPE